MAKSERILDDVPELLVQDEQKKIHNFRRKDCIFAANFNPTQSFTDYGFAAPAGHWIDILSTDGVDFDGFGRLENDEHFTVPQKNPNGNGKYEDSLFLYLPSRCLIVLKKVTK